MLLATSVLESFAEGFADAAFLTYLSGLCNPAFTATQYALLSSLAPLALRTIGGLSGVMAAAMGFCAVLHPLRLCRAAGDGADAGDSAVLSASRSEAAGVKEKEFAVFVQQSYYWRQLSEVA